MTDFRPGETISDVFRHSTTGVANTSWTKSLFKNGVPSLITVTVTETATPNFYEVEFRTDATEGAVWALDVVQSSGNNTRYQFSWRVKEVEHADTIRQNGRENPVPNMLSEIKLELQDQRNKKELDPGSRRFGFGAKS